MNDGKVLIIDDCRMTTLLLKYILGKEGLHADTAGDGLSGVEKARNKRYHLVFLDILLPGLDGPQVARRIHEHDADHAPEIILMTGMGEGFRPEMVEECGASDVFFKPIAPSKVAETARRLLSREGR